MVGNDRYPILEFDPTRRALINPRRRRHAKPAPKAMVMCFFLEVIDAVCGEGRAEVVSSFTWEHGTHQLYALETDHGPVGVFHPGVGAPMAAGMLEEAIATEGRYFVACGGAGAVMAGLALGHVIVPTSAVRDEGTSYHYLGPTREVSLDPVTVGVLSELLVQRGVPFFQGKTWTTDAPYRETSGRIGRRREEGCLTVEMETSALAAVARFRGVRFGQYLYAGDDVSGEAWDHRQWNTASGRTDLFWLAVAAAGRLAALGPPSGDPSSPDATAGLTVREIRSDERPWLRELIAREWGLPVVSTSGTYDPSELPALVADDGTAVLGAATYRMSGDGCELVTLNSLRPGEGVGTALLDAVRRIAEDEGRRLWLITTNANVRAIDFYQRRGMDMVALHRGFVDEVVRWKPDLAARGGPPPFRHAIEFSY